MEIRVLWGQEDPDGASGRLILSKDDRHLPEYTLIVDGGDTAEPYMHSVTLQRAHLAALWLAILEQADSLEWANKAISREAAIRSVMKIRKVDREAAARCLGR